MAKPPRRTSPPQNSGSQSNNQQQLIAQSSFEGPIPPPSILRGYDDVLPGAAERILRMAEDQNRHRLSLESTAMQANAQVNIMQANTNKSQIRWVGVSDSMGQFLGFIVSLTCILGGIWLVVQGHGWEGSALFSIPIAGIIKAFRNQK